MRTIRVALVLCLAMMAGGLVLAAIDTATGIAP